MDDLNAIVARLEKVEKENRWLKCVGITCLLVAACVVLMGQARPSRTLEAERFVLKDASGRVRADLFTSSESGVTMLKFINERGNALVSGNGFVLFDSDANLPANLKNFPANLVNLSRTGLHITDSWGTSILLGGGRDWEHPDKLRADIVLSDKEGFSTEIGTSDLVDPRTGGTSKTSAASVVLFGKDGKVLWSAP